MSNKHFKRVLRETNRHSPFAQLASQGATSAQLKSAVVEILSPCIDDLSLLNDLAIERLVPEAIRYLGIRNEPWSKQVFEAFQLAYHSSFSTSPSECIAIFSDWGSRISAGESAFWSIYNLDEPKVDLPTADNVFSTFRTIGNVLESSMKPLLQELLCHLRLASNRRPSSTPVQQLDFGVVVNDIEQLLFFPEAMKPPPWNISLSQWRNISLHHDFNLKGETIEVCFGPKSDRRAMEFKSDELLLVAKKAAQVFNAISAARAFFATNHRQQFPLPTAEQELRPEVQVVHLAAAISTQGFRLTDLVSSDSCIEVIIEDVVGGDHAFRMAHASQFLYPVWSHFPKDQVKIRFLPHAKSGSVQFAVDGEICQQISIGEIPFEVLASSFTATASDVGDKQFEG
ncbi:hypothetical protein OAE63_00200 [bacterium]|nr:hypothetical protein [bacterium]